MDPRGVPYPLLPLAAWDLSGRGVRAARARCQRRGTGSPDRPRATTRNALFRMVFRNADSYIMSGIACLSCFGCGPGRGHRNGVSTSLPAVAEALGGASLWLVVALGYESVRLVL